MVASFIKTYASRLKRRRSGPISVLIVDDEEPVRTFVERVLREAMTLWEDEAFLEKPCSVKGLLQAVSLLLFGKFDASAERRP